MISAFEYVTVLISIVLGLGITQILTSVADLYHKSERVTLYWPHVLWILFVLVLHVQEWWVTYELKSFEQWRLPTFLFVMAYPVNLFLLAKMLFPSTLKGKRIDLKSFYLNNYRKIFFLFIVSAILSIFYNLFILNLGIETQFLQALLVVAFSIVTLQICQHEWVHKSLSLTVVIIMIISIAIEWNVWLIN